MVIIMDKENPDNITISTNTEEPYKKIYKFADTFFKTQEKPRTGIHGRIFRQK